MFLQRTPGADEPTPLEVDAPTFDVTTEGLVTNTVQLKGSCAKGTTGSIRYILSPVGTTSSVPCGGTVLLDASAFNAIRVDFPFINPAPATDCDQLSYSKEDFPVRTKCTDNGRDASGKPLAKMEIKYVKD